VSRDNLDGKGSDNQDGHLAVAARR